MVVRRLLLSSGMRMRCIDRRMSRGQGRSVSLEHGALQAIPRWACADNIAWCDGGKVCK